MRWLSGLEFEERFNPEEQAWAILLAHGLILVMVLAIMLLAVEHIPPWQFLVGEALICFLCVLIVADFGSFAVFIGRWSGGKERKLKQSFQRWKEDGPRAIFAVAFLLQFAALTPLLLETGGPIDSPFAQLALAFAVFPPILANHPGTMLVALVSSVIYIGVMVAVFSDHASGAPRHWVFVAVSALVLLATVGLAMLDRWEGDQEGGEEP